MVERTKFGSRQIVFPGSDNNIPLQVVLWTEQRAGITFTGSSQRTILPAAADIVELTATENCYLNFGDVTVEATSTIANDASRIFLAGVQIVPVPIDPATNEPYTHIAVLQQTVSGILQMEKVA